MNRDVIRQFVNIVAVSGTIAWNSITQVLPLNNQTSADIANRFSDNYFLPANYVFSIWGIIYIGLIAFAVYQALPSQRENPRMRTIGYWFALSSLANCLWLLLFHYNQFALSTVAMIVLLVSLIVIYRRLREGSPQISTAERWAVWIPFSIYLGWITVATVANVTYVLLDARWDGLGLSYQTWGVIMLVVAALIAAAFAFVNRDLAYAAVIVWAYVGIIARFPDLQAIVIVAAIMAALVGLAALISLFMSRSGQEPLVVQRA
jgi:MFS family permease